MDINNVITTGDIVKALGVSYHLISYYLRSRNIKPIRRLGQMRLYAPEVIEKLRTEIEANSVAKQS